MSKVTLAAKVGHEILFDVKVSGTGLSQNMMLFVPNGNIFEFFQVNTARSKWLYQ